jgi:hypothetical protein
MFSKVYKQKFFSSPAKDKKVQVFENTRLFRKLAFKGSPRNRIIQGHVLKGGNAMAGITSPKKGIPRHTQGRARISKKKTFNVFKYLCPKGQFLIIIP